MNALTPAQLLARLLGPADPEITCEQCFDPLDRYVELEIDAADADQAIPGMRAHLAGCPACREDHDSLLAYTRAQRAGERAVERPSPEPAGIRAAPQLHAQPPPAPRR